MQELTKLLQKNFQLMLKILFKSAKYPNIFPKYITQQFHNQANHEWQQCAGRHQQIKQRTDRQSLTFDHKSVNETVEVVRRDGGHSDNLSGSLKPFADLEQC